MISMIKVYLWVFFMGMLPFIVNAQHNPYKAPLYWSVYENHILKPDDFENYITEKDWSDNIDWVEENLKPYGYDMICIDGWGDDSQFNEHGYRTTHSKHWEHDYAWWATNLQARGMNLGMYNNPLWVIRTAADAGVKIKGTDIPLSEIIDPEEEALWFTWVQVDRPGAEEYVKGYIQYYADMGIKYLRVDFLSWFEDGFDKNLGTVGPKRPKQNYETALRWMKEACDENGIFLSLVMPHLNNEAELEIKYGHMVRINEDVGEGTWKRFSENERGKRRPWWSQYYNTFDGYIYWSHISGRERMILDGDFIRLNTFENDEEKKSVISLHLMAGGPLTPSDQHNTIGDDLWLYQNEEMLELNYDGFVGKPLSNDPTAEGSQVWKGQLSNGDWVIGLFNREEEVKTRSLDFSELEIEGAAHVRDLWAHEDLGNMESISVTVPPHGCVILKISLDESACSSQLISFDPIPNQEFDNPPIHLNAEASSGLNVSFKVVSGPASIEGDELHLSGEPGTVSVVARQPGDETFCAALQQAQSFIVNKAQMFIGGTFTNWVPNIEMKLEGDLWVAPDIPFSPGEYELKFANTSDWSGDDWGDAVGLTGTAKISTGGAPNIRFTIAKYGTFKITFNRQTLEYTIADAKDGDVTSIDKEKPEDSSFKVYPNPASHSVKIEHEGLIGNIEVINSLGMRMYRERIMDQEIVLNIEDFPAGIYFIKINSRGVFRTKKLVIRK